MGRAAGVRFPNTRRGGLTGSRYGRHMELAACSSSVSLRRAVLVAASVVAAWAALLVVAPSGRAADYLYFQHHANPGTTSGLGRVAFDGSGLRDDLVASPVSPGMQGGLAVAGSYVYYQVAEGVSAARPVYRVAADGSGSPTLVVTPCSVSSSYTSAVEGLATDGQYLYYICSSVGSTRIGRVGLDGSGQNDEYLNPSLPGPPTSVWQIAANATHLYMMTSTDILRANLTGSAGLISTTATGGPNGIAVNASHVYWTTSGGAGGPRVVRAGLDLTNTEDVITGLTSPVSIAVTDTSIFWTIGAPATVIAKADVNGSNRNLAFVGASSRGIIQSLAIGAATPAPAPTPTPSSSTSSSTTTAPPAPTVSASAVTARTTVARKSGALTATIPCTTTNSATLTSCSVVLSVNSSLLKQTRAGGKGKTTVIGTATRTPSAGDKTIEVAVRITNAKARRVLAAKGSLRATAVITARDATGQTGTASRATTLVLPKQKGKALFRR